MVSSNSTPSFRECKICHESFPLTSEYWHYVNRRRGWFDHRCKQCRKILRRQEHIDKREHDNAVNKTYRLSHPDECKRMIRQWAKNHPEVMRAHLEKSKRTNPNAFNERSKRYYQKHRDEVCLRASEHRKHHHQHHLKLEKDWRDRNPEAVAAHNSRRRTQTRTGFTPEDVVIQFKSQRGRCWHCGKKLKGDKYHIDHLIPLSRGGTSAPENIVISCPKCNLSKGAKLTQEWNGKLF